MVKNIVTLALLVLVGCATKTPPTLQPGALNQFDQAAYLALGTAQAALEEASKQVVAYPELKPQLNAIIDIYNAAQASYKAYHKALAAGQSPDVTDLNNLVQKVKTSVGELLAKMKPKAQWRAHGYYAYAST